MIAGVVFVLAGTLVTACGTSKEAEKKELNDNKVTLDPPPGAYTYKPWIRLRTEKNGFGSGVLRIKTPGKTDFAGGSTCGFSSPYASSELFQECVEVEQTGQLVYFLENSEAKSDEVAVDYAVNLSTNNLTGSFLPGAGKPPEGFEFAEVQTSCKYDNDGQSLKVSVQLASDDRLTNGKYAYLLFSVKDPAAGVNQVYTKENDTKISIRIKPRTDKPQSPGDDFYIDYTSRPLFKDDPIISVSPSIQEDTTGSSGVKRGEMAPKCEISMDTAERGAVNKGAIKCTNLTYDRSEAGPALGAYVNIQGNWQCDRYGN